MPKSIYLFIALILSVNCWDLTILDPILNSKTNFGYAAIWAIAGFYWFRSRPGNYKIHNYKKYQIYFYWMMVGFLLSIIPAFIFWNQNLITSLIVNRHLIWYIFLPLILYIQPSEEEIMKALFYYMVTYMAIWTIQVVASNPITTYLESKSEWGFELDKTDFGYILTGYTIMLYLLYYKIQVFTNNPRLKTFLPVVGILAIFFLLQNRASLFFAIIVFGLALFRFRTQYKYPLFLLFGLLVFAAYLITSNYWVTLIQETSEQLTNPDYERWKALYFFLFDYSPHWICNILGNGFLSAHVQSGLKIQELMFQGYYQADIGILGLWSMYGVIPLIVVYSIVLKILSHKEYPFFMKAIAAHILFVPIAWRFESYDIMVLVFLCYLLAYYAVNKKEVGKLD
jgi:hypothetical protein